MMESTTSTHHGNTPIPGMASSANPGRRAHRRPKIKKRRKAVTRSSAHWKGGANVIQMDMASETAATPKAIAIFARVWRLKGEVASAGVNVMVLPDSIDCFRALNCDASDELKMIVPRLPPNCKQASSLQELDTTAQESSVYAIRALL